MIQLLDIDIAYTTLSNAYQQYAHASEELVAARHAYQQTEAENLCTGVEGKNEAERKAHLFLTLGSEQSRLVAAEQQVRKARCALDCAQTEVDRILCHLRWLEYHPRLPGNTDLERSDDDR